MDPIANLRRQRTLAAAMAARATRGSAPAMTRRTLEKQAVDAAELAELVQALDEWRAKGGFSPYGRDRADYERSRSWDAVADAFDREDVDPVALEEVVAREAARQGELGRERLNQAAGVQA